MEDVGFWKDFLNGRAAELGLEQRVKVVMPRGDVVGAVTWVFENDSGDLIDLGWSVEEAEAGLRSLSGQVM